MCCDGFAADKKGTKGWTLKPVVTVSSFYTGHHVKVFLRAIEGTGQFRQDFLQPTCPSAELRDGVACFDGFQITEYSQPNCCYCLVFLLYDSDAHDAHVVSDHLSTCSMQNGYGSQGSV